MGDIGYVWKSVEYVLTPEDSATVNVVRNAWWVVNKDGDVLFYFYERRDWSGRPQMNRDRAIARRAILHHPEARDVVQIPLAFYPIDVRDY